MPVAKQKIYSLLETVPDSQLKEIVSFIMFIKMRDESGLFKDLEALSVSSTGFWDNEIDDEVWNNA
ncbi:MAG: DUF2281 domain-containing protein [Defluviitaleaceae bacterium]|nr:DUF2281 domain-containing protein [Defluviitaleaceae bacterium]